MSRRDLDYDIANLAKHLGVAGSDAKLEQQAEAVKHWLKGHTDWLMIFDGVDERETARRSKRSVMTFRADIS